MRHQSGSKCAQIRILRVMGAAMMALAVIAALAPPAAGQDGWRTLHRNLDEMVSDSGYIVHGRILSVTIEPHPQYQGMTTVLVNLEVVEMLKGQTGAPFSFRQYLVNRSDAAAMKLTYKPGQEMLLLMLAPHPQTGLSSPAGMEQGRFRVARDEHGNRVVTNGVNNGSIFKGLDPAKNPKLQVLSPSARTVITQHRGGPIAYDDFKAIILALAAK